MMWPEKTGKKKLVNLPNWTNHRAEKQSLIKKKPDNLEKRQKNTRWKESFCEDDYHQEKMT